MTRVLRGCLLALAALTLVSGRPSTMLQERALPPDIDPFYDPPAGFESKALGAILRQRKIIPAFFGLIPQPVEGYQLLYRTEAIDGSAIATVTTIFKPLSAKKDRFVSFQIAQNSAATICQPSYINQLGAAQVGLVTQTESLIAQAFLVSGYIVSLPDYEGPEAAFAAGRLEGRGALDGIRATVNFKDTLGLSTSKPMVFGAGYSAGGTATGWAASLQPAYAPELNIKGWAAGGTPPNITGIIENTKGTIFAGLALIGINGLIKPTAYGAEFKPFIESIFTTAGKKYLDFAGKVCTLSALIPFVENSIESPKIQTLGSRVLYAEPVVKILNQTLLGFRKEETPSAPLLLYQGLNDEIVPYANSTFLADTWCNYGANIHYTTYAAGGHFTTEILGIIETLKFAEDAFSDKVATGCSKKTILDDTLDPLAIGVSLEPVLAKLLEALLKFGKEDSNVLKTPAILQDTSF